MWGPFVRDFKPSFPHVLGRCFFVPSRELPPLNVEPKLPNDPQAQRRKVDEAKRKESERPFPDIVANGTAFLLRPLPLSFGSIVVDQIRAALDSGVEGEKTSGYFFSHSKNIQKQVSRLSTKKKTHAFSKQPKII